MAFQIRKVGTFPIEIKEDDIVLYEGEKTSQIQQALSDIGFGNSKKKLVNGAMFYYKGRTNAVYVKYIKTMK